MLLTAPQSARTLKTFILAFSLCATLSQPFLKGKDYERLFTEDLSASSATSYKKSVRPSSLEIIGA